MKKILKSILKKMGYQIIAIPSWSRGSVVEEKRYKIVDYNKSNNKQEYQKIQEEGNIKKIENVWAYKENLELAAEFVKKNNPDVQFVLCHGTRNGFEQKIFSEKLKCEVLGTEISSTATNFPMTIQWDFHKVKDEWINKVDLIYSNSLDHSNDPINCLLAWVSCLKPGGFMILDKASDSDPHAITDLDPFGITIENLIMLILENFYEVVMIRSLLDVPRPKSETFYHKLLVIEKIAKPA